MASDVVSCEQKRQAEQLLRSELGDLGEMLASDIGRQAKEASEAANTGRRIAKSGVIALRFARLIVDMSRRPHKPRTRTNLCRAAELGKGSFSSIVPYVKASIDKGHGLFKQTIGKSGGKRVGERFRLADHIVELLKERQASRETKPPVGADSSVTEVEREVMHNEPVNADLHEMSRSGSTTDDINMVVSRTDVPAVLSRLFDNKRIAVKIMPR